MKRTVQSAAIMAAITVTSATAQEQMPDVSISPLCEIVTQGYTDIQLDAMLTDQLARLMPLFLMAVRAGVDLETAKQQFAQASVDGVCAQILSEGNPA